VCCGGKEARRREKRHRAGIPRPGPKGKGTGLPIRRISSILTRGGVGVITSNGKKITPREICVEKKAIGEGKDNQ